MEIIETGRDGKKVYLNGYIYIRKANTIFAYQYDWLLNMYCLL